MPYSRSRITAPFLYAIRPIWRTCSARSSWIHRRCISAARHDGEGILRWLGRCGSSSRKGGSCCRVSHQYPSFATTYASCAGGDSGATGGWRRGCISGCPCSGDATQPCRAGSHSPAAEPRGTGPWHSADKPGLIGLPAPDAQHAVASQHWRACAVGPTSVAESGGSSCADRTTEDRATSGAGSHLEFGEPAIQHFKALRGLGSPGEAEHSQVVIGTRPRQTTCRVAPLSASSWRHRPTSGGGNADVCPSVSKSGRPRRL